MSYSTVLKNKLLAVTHLKYRLVIEIKNEDGAWIDFSDRDPALGTLRLATEKRMNQVLSSIGSVSLTNDDKYFDYMDDPDNLTTLATFSTLASKFLKGFRGKLVRLTLRMFLPDGTYEDARIGVFRVKNLQSDVPKRREVLNLQQDVDFLKKISTQNVSDGQRHYENRPISYIIRELLKRFYPAGVTATDFEVPDRIYLTTADGEPAFSHWGKPPEKDSAGRWRNDITHKPMAMFYESGGDLFYFGIGDEIWTFDSDTEIWAKLGEFGDDDFQVRGIYPMATGYLFIVGWENLHSAREVTIKTGYITIATGALTLNDAGNDILSFSGEFVVRDTYDDGASGLTNIRVGTESHYKVGHVNQILGVNMPVPFPHYPHSACDAAAAKYLGPATSLRADILLANWTEFAAGDAVQGLEIENPGWIAYVNEGTGSATVRPELLVAWGMKPNLAWAGTLKTFTGPYLFCVKADGNPLGIRCSGSIRIVGYRVKDGTNFNVSESVQVGAEAPIYDLRFYSNGTYDYLYWIDVDWIEEYVDLNSYPSSNVDPPKFRIRKGYLTAGGGGHPQLLESNRSTLWTSGDDFFESEDSEFAPISLMPYPDNEALEGYILQIMDLAAMGGNCFRLYHVNSVFNAATLLGTSRCGWASFTQDAVNNRIYFLERDTGRICYVNITSVPTVLQVVGLGAEPVAQSCFEMPQAEGFTIRTELSKRCLYGVTYPQLPGWANKSLMWLNGKYYLWKYHPQLTDRIELFEEDRQDAWEALGLLAEAVNHQVGIDPEGVGFFRPIPTSAVTEEFTIDLDSPIGRYFTAKKLDGLDEIINRVTFIPYEATPGEAEATLDLLGYIKAAKQVYFNGQTYVKSEIIIERNITLHCTKAGPIGTAKFKYLVHEFQVGTLVREAVNLSAPRQLRLDSNQDLVVGMLVQVGEWDIGAKIASIETDGDVILDTDMTTAFAQGTAVIFRSAEYGKWSTEYGTPLEYLTATTFSEIGDTGLFLKFAASDEATTNNFAIGDRIRIYNPAMQLEKSRTKKVMAEDYDSIQRFGLSEYSLDNPYITLALGTALTQKLITDYAWPHHVWQLGTPLFLQAKPHVVLKIKSRRLLPIAVSNEEKCYTRLVEHGEAKARTTIHLRAVSAYTN